MRLHKLWISDFKNLKDFEIEFDKKSYITVVVGWNGTGKSNLVEALVIIFRDLDLGQNTAFAYRIEYECHGNNVKIDYDPKRKNRLKKETTPVNFALDGSQTKKDLPYLPAFVFGYYSGPSNRLKDHFAEHQRRYYDAILNAESADASELRKLKSLRQLFYAENHHSKYVLLAFFLKRDEKIKGFLKKYLRIEDLESVLFVMKKPSWTSKEGDPRFWNARGLVQKVLDKLFSVSLAPMRLMQNLPGGIKKRSQQELFYLYIKDHSTLTTFAQDYETPSDFFASLESTDLSEVIHDVIVKVKIRSHDGTLTFRELSEGEQQLLMVLGLMRFTKEQESLILLDEPDTHLNPFWSTEYIELIKEIVDDEKTVGSDAQNDTRHILLSTHDPLVIAGLEKEQIQIFKRDPETDRCYAEIPDRSPRGMGFEGVLTSDMFGFRSALDKPTLEKLDRKRRLVIKENLTREDQQELEQLNQEIGELDFTNVVRDDYYRLFAREMAKFEEDNKIGGNFLTPEQRKAREEFAKQLVARLARQKKEDESKS